MGEWKNYFVYTKRERQAVIFLLGLTLILLAIPHLFEPPLVPVSGHLKEPIMTIDTSEVLAINASSEPLTQKSAVRTGELSFFNPNTARLDELMKLGISEKAATVIIHYREKGGKFRRAEDLSKIYSIPKDLYEKLKPYVWIPGAPSKKFSYERSDSIYSRSSFIKNERRVKSIEINSAVQAEWESLPGIGAKLALRIMTFRDKLGGFIKAEQVKETFGITDSVFDIIRPMLLCINPSIRKFDLNSITIEELKQHPYFRGKIAYAIIRYREQHGSFKSMDDLRKLQVLDEVMWTKIEPYLIIKSS